MSKRVFSDTGMWNPEALKIIHTELSPVIRKMYDDLKEQGWNCREARLMIEETALDEGLMAAIDARDI